MLTADQSKKMRRKTGCAGSRLDGESKRETQGYRVFLQHGIVGMVPWSKYYTEPLPFGVGWTMAGPLHCCDTGFWPGLCIPSDLDPLYQPPRQEAATMNKGKRD